ncbi:formate dehydrogenase accessory sulfurtransferase FdhD [Nocardioides sp. YIM 152315]|uniref:formate dehydrogenase accessory sulfurtransferase FdhD n=1 Tax=Nocardioides sp. YIM 152315 TaxID=3031760 RepID=UPI0023DB86AB|nr:formate dehydrogenase accessory sulfurtransferase FdhD [Nocardioides sp. YIM 152315]MDF1605853.1 formate dehydrogenase accessory sulfurtransferase FdhD [Nocardioides sp. YIM 152315]
MTEEPLEIRLAAPGTESRRVWVTMRTPGHDFELAAGWMVHEGFCLPTDIHRIAYCTDVDLAGEEEYNVVTVTLSARPYREPGARHAGHSSGSSACGVCGKDSISEALDVQARTRWPGAVPLPETVRRLPEIVREQQRVFGRTGGAHAAALVSPDGDVLVVREDVGRHNAVDKVTGARVLAGEDSAAACLFVSGRAGFELVQKAVSSGVASLVAVGAPTSLSVDLAKRSGLVLYGFTKSDRCVRYA